MAEHFIRHERSNCVNLFRKFERVSEQILNQIIQMLMLRYPVFLDAGNLIQETQASSSHFRRLTNIRRIGISNIKEQDEKVKIEGDTKRSIFV